jgi:hypothetical protein
MLVYNYSMDPLEENEELGKKGPCWEGYVQRGMKPGKDGNPVPNCVPVSTKKSFWDGKFDNRPFYKNV